MNLLMGLPMMVVCLLLQTLLIVVAVRYYLHSEYLLNSPSLWSSTAIVSSVMVILVVGNFCQIAVWALLFRLLGEFDDYSDAFYHSAVNFATLGYGDIVMSPRHRLLGPLEAINGVLMIGVSTATLMTAFQDALRRRSKARQHLKTSKH